MPGSREARHSYHWTNKEGAGNGNRTRICYLASSCSTTELHPHFNDLPYYILCRLCTTYYIVSGCPDSNWGPPRPKRGALPSKPHPEQGVIISFNRYVPRAGLEPAWLVSREILSLLRIPFRHLGKLTKLYLTTDIIHLPSLVMLQ